MFEDTEYKFKQMRHVGALTKECLDIIGERIVAGMQTRDIDVCVAQFAKKYNLRCATSGYKGFPADCCVSLNEIACHGIPNREEHIRTGDLVKVDVTFINEAGYHGDACRTYGIGKVDMKGEDLIYVAREALWKGIEAAQPGKPTIEIGMAINKFVHKFKMHVLEEYCGHSIGLQFHTRPLIFHTPQERELDSHVVMEPGMTFTIEPIITLGKAKTKVLADGWSVRTIDKKRTAQFEHTVGITKDGNEVFTA